MDMDSQNNGNGSSALLQTSTPRQQNIRPVQLTVTASTASPSPSSPPRSRRPKLPLTPPTNAHLASASTTTIPAGITIIPPSPLSLNSQPKSQSQSQSHFVSSPSSLPSSLASSPFFAVANSTPRAGPGPSTQRTRSSTFCPASQSHHQSSHRREETHPHSRPGPARAHSHYIYRRPDSQANTSTIRSNGLPPPLKRLSIDEFTTSYNNYSYSVTTGSDAQTPTQENGHSGIHRRRPSLTGSNAQSQVPSQSPRLRQASSEQKLRSPITTPASSSTLGWLTGNRLTLPPTHESHSKSDDEREDEEDEEESQYAESESDRDRGNRHRQAIWSEKNRRTLLERDWRMPANFVQYGEPSSSSGSGTPSISMTPPETKSILMPQGLPIYGNTHNVSPPRTTILPSQAPLASASLQPLPQDPFNILPLSLPSSPYASPVPSRSATPLHSAHPSMADLAAEFAATALPPAPPTSGSGSSPRTSISTSSSRYGWNTGRSDSRSSEEDDVVPAVTTSHRAWWQQRSLLNNHNQNDAPVSPKIQISTATAPRIIRLPSSSNKFVPTGTRSWGWLFGMIPSTFSASSAATSAAAAQSKSEPVPRKNSISAKARNRERDRLMGGPGRRRTNQKVLGSKWLARLMVFVPTEPWSISFFLLFIAFLAVSLTFTIKHILNPDKEPLPWREYCTADYPTLYSLQDPTLPAPHIDSHVNSNPAFPSSSDVEVGYNSFAPSSSKALTLMPLSPSHPAWPYHPHEVPPYSPEMSTMELDQALEPVGILIGVFTTDSGAERRHMIRQSYASHWRSRRDGTEGVRVRFVMGRPRKRYEQAVQLEMEAFNDILLLDIEENMNSGKTHAFFSWAAENATVPDWEYPSQVVTAEQEETDDTAERTVATERAKPIWKGEKRPSYVVKADDDSFIMLAELEKRLRVAPRNKAFWGYLVKNSFMAGECYALSFDLVKYIGASPALRTLTHGKEDKLVAKWMNMHPEREQIVWVTERCWIYDHPKAGTVYSHGFLFPSTVAQVRAENSTGLAASTLALRGGAEAARAYSTVSKFGVAYRPLSNDMSASERIEALIEGSELSLLRDEILLAQSQTSSSSSSSSEDHLGQHAFSKIESNRDKINRAFASRPTRADRFLGDPEERGGTVVVHYIKKPEWFVETSIALLGGADDQAVWHRGVGMGLGALERRKGRVAKGMDEGRLQSHVGTPGVGMGTGMTMGKGDDGL